MFGLRAMNSAYWTMRILFGLGILAAGADKFVRILANWDAYLSPHIAKSLPLPASTFMQIVGGVEIVVGLCILAGLTRTFGYIAMILLLGTAANLAAGGMFYDIAMRHVMLAAGAFSLARLTDARLAVAASPLGEEY